MKKCFNDFALSLLPLSYSLILAKETFFWSRNILEEPQVPNRSSKKGALNYHLDQLPRTFNGGGSARPVPFYDLCFEVSASNSTTQRHGDILRVSQSINQLTLCHMKILLLNFPNICFVLGLFCAASWPKNNSFPQRR